MKIKAILSAAILCALATAARANYTNLYVGGAANAIYVRSASSWSTLQTPNSKGYCMIKYDSAISPTNTGTGAAKAWYRYDFTGAGVIPNTNASIKFLFRHQSNAGATHEQVWALNQAAAGTFAATTWQTAPGNDTNSNSMMTSGAGTTATLLADFIGGTSSGTPDVVSLDAVGPAAWGKFLINGQIVLAVTAPDDQIGGGAVASSNGQRYNWNNTATATNPSVEFFDTTGFQPPLFITVPPDTNCYAHHAGSVTFQITNDPSVELGVGNLVVSAATTGSSSNVVPNDATLSTSAVVDTNGNVTLNFNTISNGTATVKVYIYNSTQPTLTNSTQFKVTATPNPQLAVCSNTNGLLSGATYSGTAVVGSPDVPLSSLNLSLANKNPAMSYTGIGFSGSGSNRTVNFTAPAATNGVDQMYLTVTDTSSYSYTLPFWVMARPSTSVLFNDHFDYYLTNSGGYGWNNIEDASLYMWYPRGGGATHIRITNCYANFQPPFGPTTVWLRASGTGIPMIADLADKPFPQGSHTKIYTSYSLYLNQNGAGTILTNAAGSGAMSHLWDGTNGMCGVIVCTNGAAAGTVRLGIINNIYGSVTNNNGTNVFPLDLAANPAGPSSPVIVVTRYDVDSQISTLWVNPASESSLSVSASDGITNQAPVISVGLRNDSGLWGDTLLDDLIVAKSFADATGIGTPPTTPAVYLQSPAGISTNGATLNAQCNPGGDTTFVYFQYGTTTNYGSYSTTNSLAAGNSYVAAGSAISGLSAGTTYQYKAVAVNSIGTATSTNASFTTTSAATATSTTVTYKLNAGALELSFTNTPGLSFILVGTNNVTAPKTNWPPVPGSTVTEISSGQYRVTNSFLTNKTFFYQIRTP